MADESGNGQDSESDGAIDNIFGLLANKTNRVATLEEIEETIAEGWANVEEYKKK